MNMCDNDHEDIVFDGRDCPLCKANEEIEDLKGDIIDLNEKLEISEEEKQNLIDEKINQEISDNHNE